MKILHQNHQSLFISIKKPSTFLFLNEKKKSKLESLFVYQFREQILKTKC